MKEEINIEWIYKTAPGEVWEYLTQAELMELWLMPNNFKAIPGYEFQFRKIPDPKYGLDGVIHCKVLEIVPFQKLVYSWKGGPGNGVFTLDTVVEWKLEKHGDDTKLILKQTGFKETNHLIFMGMSEGWRRNVQKMVDRLDIARKDFTTSVEIAASPKDVFDHINQVSKWWPKDVEGGNAEVNDAFVLRHGDVHYSKQQVIEVTPDKRIVWLVTDSKLSWIKNDKYEWTNTKMVFEITPKGAGSVLHFTHEGLVPEKECYVHSVEFWNRTIKEWADNIIANGRGKTAKVIFGNHSSVMVPRQDRDNILAFYCDVLGGQVMRADPERDFIRLGEDFFIAFLYGDVPDESEFLRSSRSVWLEIKSDDVEGVGRKILGSGLVRKLEIPDPHLYFQAPGGQCLRLVGIEEDLSFYEGVGDGPNMTRIKEALKKI